MFFSTKKAENIALIDIESSSVAGALARVPEEGAPVVFYSSRLPIAVHEGEAKEDALARALKLLGENLVEQGGPVLRRETGSGHVSSVLAVIGSPWNDTSVRVATIEKPQEFSFTKTVLADAIAAGRPQSGDVRREELVIATLLNGYDVNEPFGKRARRADLIILSSAVSERAASVVLEALRRTFHTDHVRLASFAPAAYAVFRDLFPHEKDFLLVHVSGEGTDLVFVKRGLLVDVASVPQGIRALTDAVGEIRTDVAPPEKGEGVTVRKDREGLMSSEIASKGEAWLATLSAALRKFSERHPLPRNVFLISRAEGRAIVELLLANTSLHSLWLSDEPLSVIPFLPEHLAPYVKTRGEAGQDSVLALLALYATKKSHALESELR